MTNVLLGKILRIILWSSITLKQLQKYYNIFLNYFLVTVNFLAFNYRVNPTVDRHFFEKVQRCHLDI